MVKKSWQIKHRGQKNEGNIYNKKSIPIVQLCPVKKPSFIKKLYFLKHSWFGFIDRD